MMEQVIRWGKMVLALAIFWTLVWASNSYGCHKVQGGEMLPSLSNEEFKLLRRLKDPLRELRPLDRAVYELVDPGIDQTTFVARVMAFPGDRVKIVKGNVYVNSNPLKADFVDPTERTEEEMSEIVVPRDTLFVLCDARTSYQRYDSRGVGPIHVSAVLGKLD